MKHIVGSLLAIALGILAIVPSLTLTGCKDQYPASILQADTVTRTDTLIQRDTVIHVDTVVHGDTLIRTDTLIRVDTVIRGDTLVHTDTLIHIDTLLQRDTLRDTIDLDDSNIWVYRNSGTTDNLIIAEFVNQNNGFIGGGPSGTSGDGVILSSGDRGTTWQVASTSVGTSGFGGSGVYGLAFQDAQNAFAVGDGQNVLHSMDGGHTWTGTPSGSTFFLRSLWFLDYKTGFFGTSDPANNGNGAGADGEIWRTTDGGVSWNLVASTNGGIYEIRFINPSNGVALGRFGVAYWTSDGGATWNQGTTDQTGNTSLIGRAAFTTGSTGFAACYLAQTQGAILRTDDEGHTWHTVKVVPAGISGIATNGAGVITACGEGGTVVESTDGGTTWTTSNVGTSRWIGDAYSGTDRTVLVGVNGRIATRDK